MAKGYESWLTLYENDGWFDSGTSNPIVPVIESEGFSPNLITNERTSMVRDTRAQLEESFVYTQEYKPDGFIEVIPRLETIPAILMSHFQIVDEVATGSSFINTFVPLRTTPQYLGNDIYGTGSYGATADDVYSIDIKKNLVGENTDLDDDTVHFKRGICDKLSFSFQAGEDFKVRADYKFKSVEFLNSDAVFGDADVGSYTSGTLTDWSHGTWSISFDSGESIISDSSNNILSGMLIECSNNLTESKRPGSKNRELFNFGNYTVKGKFSLEYTDDRWYEQLQNGPMHITGTIFHTNTEFMTIDLPRCFLKPFNKGMVKPDTFLEAEVDFEAYERNGTSPITVQLHITDSTPDVDLVFWDAFFGARILSEFDFADAGFASRILSEFDFADRDI